MTQRWFNRVHDLTIRLVSMPSLTASTDEAGFAARLCALLTEEMPYFKEHPDHLRVSRTVEDPHERSIVYALVRGSGLRTIILTGHYDTVSTAVYGDLQPLACDPEQLRTALVDRIRAIPHPNASDAALLADLNSGTYMPGRGALDMKSGLAAGLAVLEAFAGQPDRVGNLLFMAVPDEEATSQGMRSAVRQLPGIAHAWGLDLAGAVNLDSGSDQDGDGGRAVYLGSVGKLLPSVYFVGRPAHAGAPFDGVNASLLAAELTREIECNPDIGDSAPGSQGERSAPPPVNLYQTDRRASYDVTMPNTAWVSYNLLLTGRTADRALADMRDVVGRAMRSALGLITARMQTYAERTGKSMPPRPWIPRVLTYAELYAQAEGRGAGPALRRLAEALSQDPSIDSIAFSQRMIDALVLETDLEGPAAVICNASLYYPIAELGTDAASARLEEAVSATVARANTSGHRIHIRPFFTGISDMSFLAGRDSAEAIDAVTANTPSWGTRLRFDYGVAAALGVPIINIGPTGHAYHQRGERVNMPYSFETVPELIWRTCAAVLVAA